MGEWSEYFEDFPEENPANYVGNRFDPKAAEALQPTRYSGLRPLTRSAELER